MATYTYRCEDCNVEWDEQRPITDCCIDFSGQNCPECGDPICPRVWSPGKLGVVLKGSGWASKDR